MSRNGIFTATDGPLEGFEVDLADPKLFYVIASVAFNPVFWNIAARLEFNHGVITKIAGGKKKNGCYLLAATIFLLGIFRDYLYEQALRAQPTAGILDDIAVRLVGVALFLGGNILVLSSMYQLGITGTYLGDYFGILMDSRVTAFPFNVTDNPMYYGSFMSFLGTALYYGKIAGIYISVFVLIMYVIALRFEEPFTAAIYSRRAEQLRKKAR